MGKTFLTCTCISVGATGFNPQMSLQNKVLRSFRIVTAVTQGSVTKARGGFLRFNFRQERLQRCSLHKTTLLAYA